MTISLFDLDFCKMASQGHFGVQEEAMSPLEPKMRRQFNRA